MKRNRLLIFAGSAFALVVAAIWAVTIYWERHQPIFKDADKLMAAMAAYSRDLTNKGQAVPATVALNELVSRGYISSNSVRAFEGMEVTIWLNVDDAYPPAALIAVLLPNGMANVALADGSVQGFAPQEYAQLMKEANQRNEAIKQGRAQGPETNGASGR
jgi:prepilin-type processing-associated H-X9-DG protein